MREERRRKELGRDKMMMRDKRKKNKNRGEIEGWIGLLIYLDVKR